MDRRRFMKMAGMVVVGMSLNGIAGYHPKFFVHGTEWTPTTPFPTKFYGDRVAAWDDGKVRACFLKEADGSYHLDQWDDKPDVEIQDGKLVYKRK